MRYGLFLPPFDELADPHRLMDVAASAEAAGWDGMFLWDHLDYVPPVRQILDPYTCLAAIATVTSTMQIGPMITPLTRRRLAVLARQAATLDILSRGRLVLGLGLGDDADIGERSSFTEFADDRARGRALSEGLETLTGLLSGREVTHSGEFYRVDGVTFEPVSRRLGGVPIWLAARWPHPAPLRRAAKYQGVVVIQLSEPDDVAKLRDQLLAEGADLDSYEIALWAGDLGSTDAERWDRAGVTWVLRSAGPFDIRFDEVARLVSEGPRR
ncbi:MAG TPA: LLM class flavin-dependent oxidoreductase [Acidimicrobiales bacterium]|nr:LLM class flavin-dependent oxidoreductase [Acidimicrobiales bacterium]